MAVPLDRQSNFTGTPSAEGISNKFDGEVNPDQGETSHLDPAIQPNKFPRETGSDTYTGIPGDGSVPG